MKMDRSPVDYSAADNRPTAQCHGIILSKTWNLPVLSNKREDISVDATDQGIVCSTQPGRILCNHVQHRLNIRRRAGDRAQNLARRWLLLQRLTEGVIANFKFLEQPHVLNGDHGLIGESLEK